MAGSYALRYRVVAKRRFRQPFGKKEIVEKKRTVASFYFKDEAESFLASCPYEAELEVGWGWNGQGEEKSHD